MSCFVKSCKNYHQKCRNEDQCIIFHRFPADEERRNEWISACGQLAVKWKSSKRICSAHFEMEDYLVMDSGVLKRCAVPTKNLGEIHESFVSERKIKQLQMEISKWKSMFQKLKEDSREKRKELNTKISKLTLVAKKWKNSKDEHINIWKKKYLRLKDQAVKQRQAIVSQKLDIANQRKDIKKNEFTALSLADLPGELVVDINSENWQEHQEDLTLEEKCEFGGQEYLAGFLCKKLSKKYSNMVLSTEERQRVPQSWTQDLSQGHLVTPSYDWLNLFRQMNQYFLTFHCYRNGCKWPLNDSNGVVEVLSKRIQADYPDVDFQLIKHFVRLRTFIRIKHINNKISNTKLMLKKWKKNQKFVRSSVPALGQQIL